MRTILTSLLCVLVLSAVSAAGEPRVPTFRAETIDDAVQIGYGTAIGDVDGDGKPDVLLADKKQFVWYQGPTWKKHVIAENLTERDNVCIAARDINGDGKVEIAVGAEWNPGDTVNSGAVFYLIPPEDRTQRWKPVELHHEPVIHRMRWLKLSADKFVLIVSPLHGRGNRNGQGAGVRLMAYEIPDDPASAWKTTVIEDTMHVTHNLDPVQWDPTTPAEEILYSGDEGAMLISYDDGQWSKKPFQRVETSSEIRMGLLAKNEPYLATIEPWHGTKLVVYRSGYRRDAAGDRTALTGRVVLDADMQQGHAIATADLFGNGSQQIVAGWRNPNSQKKIGVKLYYPTGPEATDWQSVWIDEDGMATEDVRICDLNADGRPDVVAAGRSTHNLKIYWNLGPK